MKLLVMASAALTAIISAGVFAGNLVEQEPTVETSAVETGTNVEMPCAVVALGPGELIPLEPVSSDKFANFCTHRMFERAKKIPFEEFVWSVYDMQRTAGKPLTPIARLTTTFNAIDGDGDKLINMAELNKFTGSIKRPTLGVEGCGTCDSRGAGCSAKCHCHKNGSCGKDGDDAGFSMEGALQKQ